MSVTFHAARPRVVSGYAASCFCYGGAQDYRGPVVGSAAGARASHDQRVAERGAHACDSAGEVSVFETYSTDGDPEVNVSNRNAAMILEAVGLPVTETGKMPADKFLEAVLPALALLPADEGVPTVVEQKPGRATIIDCGTRPGYLQDRLEALCEVAAFAKASGVAVVWG